MLVSTTGSVIVDAKYSRKTLSGLELSFKCGTSLFLLPLGPPVKVCTTPQRAMYTVDLIHSENHQRHLSKLNCWMLDHWMLGGPVVGVTPLVLETSLFLRRAITWGCCVFTFTVPNQFRNLVCGQELSFLEPPLMAADEGIFSAEVTL